MDKHSFTKQEGKAKVKRLVVPRFEANYYERTHTLDGIVWIDPKPQTQIEVTRLMTRALA